MSVQTATDRKLDTLAEEIQDIYVDLIDIARDSKNSEYSHAYLINLHEACMALLKARGLLDR